MADLTGGRAVVELLKAEGVRYIFGIVGSTFLDVKLCQGVRHTQQVRGLLESQLTNTRPDAAAV